MALKKIKFMVILALLILVNADVLPQQKRPVCALLPFKNKSGFDNNNWDIGKGIPTVFSDSLKKLGKYQIIEPIKIDEYSKSNKIRSYQYDQEEVLNQLATELKIDHFVIGLIDEFSLSRVNVGSFLVGGYESYKTQVKINFFIFNRIDSIKTDNYVCSSEVQKKDLGINLVGRPSENYVSFEALDTLEFNSPEFNQTIIGEALKELTADFVGKFIKLVQVESVSEPEDLTRVFDPEKYKEAAIVFRRDDEVYLNAGSTDRIREGEVLKVFTEGDQITDPETGQVLGFTDKFVGKITVIIVKDKHLSIAKIIEQLEPIKVKDKVRIRRN